MERRRRIELVAMGCSWGGFDALGHVLGALPPGFPAPIVAVQHRSADVANDGLVAGLAARSPLPVREVDDKAPIERGVVHLAPADYHLLVADGAFELSIDAPVRFSRPSIDVLFESAADEYREGVVGVLLTGANDDGAAGLQRIRSAGGFAVVQDPDSAERPEMPRAAIRAGAADQVLPLDAIPAALTRLCGTGHGMRSS